MTANFENVWSRITSSLRDGTLVRNWGVARGYTGGSFTVTTTGSTWITVAGGNMKTERRVSKGDFEKVYAVWHDYVEGNFSRLKLTPISQNSTYILSIYNLVLNEE